MAGPEKADVQKIVPPSEEKEEKVASVNWDDVMGPREKVAKVEPTQKVETPVAQVESPTKIETERVREVARTTEKPQLDIKDQDILTATTHVVNAELAGNLVQINESKQPDNTKIQVADANGRPVTTTLGEYKQQIVERLKQSTEFAAFDDPAKLREFVSQSTEAAIKISQQAREKIEVGNLATDKNSAERQALAKELGFAPSLTVNVPDGKGGFTPKEIFQVTKEEVTARIASAKTPEEKEKLTKMTTLLTENQQIQVERNALTVVAARSAQLLMGGLTHQPGDQTVGQSPATRQEIMRAYELVSTAGRTNRAMESSDQFKALKETSGLMYADIQLQRSKEAVVALQAADKARSEGKPEAEVKALYEESLKKAKDCDMASVRANLISQEREYTQTQTKLEQLADTPANKQQRDRLTAELRQREEIATQLAQILQVNKEVKTQYATWLNERGKGNEALPLLTSAMSETPEYTTPERDPAFAAELEKSQRVKNDNLQSVDTKKAMEAYQAALGTNNFAEAEKQLNVVKEATSKVAATSIQDAKDKLSTYDATKAKLQTELDDLKKNQTMDETAKKIREEQLTNEIAGYDQLRKPYAERLPAMEEAARKQGNEIKYMELVIAASRHKDGDAEAHRLALELKASAPELANNKDYQIDELIEATREKGFWERNFDTIVNVAKIGACIVAIGVAGTLVPGVGGIAVAAALGAAGVFTVGAAGHATAQALDYKSTDNYHNWRPGQDLAMGAAGGAGGHALQVLFAGGGLLSTTAIGSTRFGQAVLTTGKFATSLPGAAATGSTIGFGHQAVERFNGNKTWDTFIADGAMESAGIAGALYSGGRFGMGSFKGSSLIGASLSGQEQARAVYHGKDLMTAGSDFALNTLAYGGSAFMVGKVVPGMGNMNLARAATFAEVPGAAMTNVGNLSKVMVYDGLMGGTTAAYRAPLAATLATGGIGYLGYRENSNYYDSRREVQWNDPDLETRKRANITFLNLAKPIRTPKIEVAK